MTVFELFLQQSLKISKQSESHATCERKFLISLVKRIEGSEYVQFGIVTFRIHVR